MQRRKMRKGTRSCQSCRRRKARCVFRPEHPSSCVDCLERGVPCQDQNSTDAENPQSDVTILSDRVAHLEALIQSMSHGNAVSLSNYKNHSAYSSSESMDRASATKHGPSLYYQHNATILGLFDNAILALNPESGKVAPWKENDESQAFNSISLKDLQVCRELLSLLPSPADLHRVLQVTGGWFKAWKHLFGEINADKDCATLEQFVSSCFEQQNPVRVAMGLLCLVTSLQSRSGFDEQPEKLNLLLPMDFSNHYLSLVDRLVISDDEYAGSVEYVELIAMYAKCCVQLGKIWKSWSYFRRAISQAQLLGLHQDHRRDESETSSQSRKDGWWSLNILDRFTSLLLGLPYAATLELDDASMADIGDGSDTLTVLYHRKLTVIAGMVIDRNQQPNPSLSTTIEIEQKLNEVSSALPDSWWDVDLSLRKRPLNSEPFYRRLMSQHWASHIRMFLHLPFAFKSVMESQFEYNRLACLDAARAASKIYHLLRQDVDAAFHLCTMLDFSGFLAALILLLGRAQCRVVADSQQVEQDDEAVISATCAVLLKASTETGGKVAVQGLQVLETLKNSIMCGEELNTSWNGTLTVPYFGSIKISAGNFSQDQRQGSPDIHTATFSDTQQTFLGGDKRDENMFLSEIDVGDSLNQPDIQFPQIDIDWQYTLGIGDPDETWSFLTD